LHAADAPAFDPTTLAAVPTERQPCLHFGLHPSVQLISSIHPVLRIYGVHRDGFDGDPAANLDTGGVQVLVTRRGTIARIHPGWPFFHG